MATRKYTISEMSEISKITKKALRHYDEFGLLPARRTTSNNYRYYTDDELLLSIPLKYYKQLGFTLEEIQAAFRADKNSFLQLRRILMQKLGSLQVEESTVHMRITAVTDWSELLNEADLVLQNNLQNVSAKYIQPARYLVQEQVFDNDTKAAIINLAFTDFVEEMGNNVTGPVIIHFLSSAARMNREAGQGIRVLQRTVAPCPPEHSTDFGGFLAASCYHIGPHETIHETYAKLQRWCRENGYQCEPDVYERYVADYWTTNNSGLFVTEVLMGISRLGRLGRGSEAAR